MGLREHAVQSSSRVCSSLRILQHTSSGRKAAHDFITEAFCGNALFSGKEAVWQGAATSVSYS